MSDYIFCVSHNFSSFSSSNIFKVEINFCPSVIFVTNSVVAVLVILSICNMCYVLLYSSGSDRVIVLIGLDVTDNSQV